MKALGGGGVEMQLHPFLTTALDGGEWLNFTPRTVYSQEITPVPIE
jgi:hypothetical protein